MYQSFSHVVLNKDNYACDPNDYPITPHEEYNQLILRDDIRLPEREAGLMNDLANDLFSTNNKPNLLIVETRYSSFRAYNSKDYFDKIQIFLLSTAAVQEATFTLDNISKLQMHNVSIVPSNLENVSFDHNGNKKISSIISSNTLIYLSDMTHEYIMKHPSLSHPIISCLPTIIADRNINILDSIYSIKYPIADTGRCLYLNPSLNRSFQEHFHYYLDPVSGLFQYDNLIHFCVMVKNGGQLFEKMLEANLHLIDRWTILDTGSTDDTVNVIKRLLVGKKKGNLYEEPFINFRESRNRCLDLAGQTCKFNLMLDDTYVVEGKLREFLHLVRGDQFADSFSLVIRSNDSEYYSNRITKSKNKLRYIYTIHEVIQNKDNKNVTVPRNVATVLDLRDDYMEERTMARKQYDLECLFDMVKEYPDDPRHLYYIAQTYNILKDYDKACEYFYKRAFHPVTGFDQEKCDALFELTRNYQYHLKPPRPWEECERYYKMLYEWDKERPEGPYFIGIHYYLTNQLDKAFEWFKLAFRIGYPLHRQYSLKPTLSYHFCPKYVAELAYRFKDFKLMQEACKLFLEKNKPTDDFYDAMRGYAMNADQLVMMPTVSSQPIVPSSPLFVFVADGGFKPWSGSSIEKDGVGGSETYIIELATYIHKLTNFDVVVFCRCEKEEKYKGVGYAHISRFAYYAATYHVHYCVISRYSEYIPVAVEGHVENIYVVLHDLDLTSHVTPVSPKIKNFFCLSEWHRDLWARNYPQFDAITKPFHYGVDFRQFHRSTQHKVRGRFIFSSFANRGLKTVLQLWPRLVANHPHISLHIFCDLTNHWLLQHYAQEVEEIKAMLQDYNRRGYNIINFGWVSKQRLAEAWAEADVWFYPCKFAETFCLTALEAAITRTMVITNDLAALKDTVGDRGIVIPGDATTEEWKETAFVEVCNYLQNSNNLEFAKLKSKNYKWACTHNWEDRARDLLENYVLLQPIEQYINNRVQQMFKVNSTPINVPDVGQMLTYGKNELISEQLMQGNGWETELYPIIDKYISATSTVIDAGAFIGTHSLALSRKVNRVIACEPYLASFNLLSSNVAINQRQNIECFNMALSDKEEVLDTMWIPLQLFNHGCARFDEEFKDINTPVKGRYELTTIDILADKLKLDNVDLIKIDTEGFEDKIIAGAKQTILRFKPAILIENKTNGSKYNELHNLGYIETECITTPFHSNSMYIHSSKNPRKSSLSSSNDSLRVAQTHFVTSQSMTVNDCGMKNWTHDLPTNSKQIFLGILDYLIHRKDPIYVLEVGTYAGTSLIAILQHLPNSFGTAVDAWTDYEEYSTFMGKSVDLFHGFQARKVEEIFDSNMRAAKLEDRVERYKGDSAIVLPKLIEAKKRFDFIYVDGSHKALDCFADLIMTWHLLKPNGILAIDDYPYNAEYDLWESPYNGVNRFLEKFKDQYLVLSKQYRVFLLKQ